MHCAAEKRKSQKCEPYFASPSPPGLIGWNQVYPELPGSCIYKTSSNQLLLSLCLLHLPNLLELLKLLHLLQDVLYGGHAALLDPSPFLWTTWKDNYNPDKWLQYSEDKRSLIRETLNRLTCADSSTNTKTDRNGKKGPFLYIYYSGSNNFF